jgi:hypothetical protein
MEQQNTALSPVAVGGGFERVDQLHEDAVEAEDGVVVFQSESIEEAVANEALLGFAQVFGAVRQNHIVEALVRVARDFWVLTDYVEVLLEAPFPVDLAVVVQVQLVPERVEEILAEGHGGILPRKRCVASCLRAKSGQNWRGAVIPQRRVGDCAACRE